jgi:hypothetical protein
MGFEEGIYVNATPCETLLEGKDSLHSRLPAG